jgi:hypothetical protein
MHLRKSTASSFVYQKGYYQLTIEYAKNQWIPPIGI